MYKETVLKISMYYQHLIDVNKKDLKQGKIVNEPNILSGLECFQYF